MSQTNGQETLEKEAKPAPTLEVAEPESPNLPAEAPKKTAKVELDLEDAPFLKEEEPQEKEKPKEQGAAPAEAEAAPKKSKKKLIIMAAAALVLIIAAALAVFFLTRGAEAPPPPPAEPEVPKPEVIVVPSKSAKPVTPDLVKHFEKFIIPLSEDLHVDKFLICKFATITKNPALDVEIDQKMLVLRDSVYFYLRGKSFEYLLDAANTASIKKDLLSILNDYLSMGKLDDVLLDNYLSQ
ncbi:MAG: flagellar basal body-associated FliL family protein [Desulfovibrio sp.]|nr:flagellar basal body-associated FliL family protein [Desulfovibrio sp.]